MPEIKYNLDVIDKAIADLSILAASSNPGLRAMALGIIDGRFLFGGASSGVSTSLGRINSSLTQAQSSFSSLVAATRDALAKTRAAISTADSNLGGSY